jgi:hypothetical protein
MPNKYEREIEEILRNMEQTEPRPSLRDRLNMRKRRPPKRPEMLRPRTASPPVRLTLSASEWYFLVGLLLGLIAAAWAYVHDGEGTPLTGFLAVLGFLFVVAGMIVAWRERTRPIYNTGTWRGERPTRERSLPRPLRALVTRWKIMRLRLRYRRRRKGDEGTRT